MAMSVTIHYLKVLVLIVLVYSGILQTKQQRFPLNRHVSGWTTSMHCVFSCATFLIHCTMHAHLLGIGALPAPRKVYVIGMACSNVQMGVNFHGCSSPSLEVGSMGGFGHVVQQPGCRVTQLVA